MADEISEQKEQSNITGSGATTKKKSKDSVFVNLFEDDKYVLQLYKELHPEDTKVTLNDIKVVTLKTVLVNTIYNDLGFIVKDGETAKYVFLVESQSTWNPNMSLRMLFYIAETYRLYLKNTKQSVHLNTRVILPEPELYIVYSGDRKVAEEISLKDDFFDGNSPIDLKIKILSKTDTTIHGQYIGFCKVYNEQRKIYKNSTKCIEETIRICLEKGYLTDYLFKHKKEVFTMMSELFDEQAQRNDYNIARDEQVRAEGRAEGKAEGRAEGITEGRAKGIAEGRAKGRAEGKAEGKNEGKLDVALNLLALGTISKEDIAAATGFTLERIKELATQGKTIIA